MKKSFYAFFLKRFFDVFLSVYALDFFYAQDLSRRKVNG